MSYRIDPDDYCTAHACNRPKAPGEDVCSLCRARTSDSDLVGTGSRELAPEVLDYLADERNLPRCVAYLSKAGDVITLELTGEPKFTEADVELVASALSNMRKAA